MTDDFTDIIDQHSDPDATQHDHDHEQEQEQEQEQDTTRTGGWRCTLCGCEYTYGSVGADGPAYRQACDHVYDAHGAGPRGDGRAVSAIREHMGEHGRRYATRDDCAVVLETIHDTPHND